MKLVDALSEVYNKDTQRWLDIIQYPLDTNGHLHGRIYILRDITEKKRVETILREQKEFLEALIDSSPVAMVTTDMDQTVLSCNPAFEIMFEYSGDEVLVQEFVSGLWLWEVIAIREQKNARGLQLLRDMNIDPVVVARRILVAFFWSGDEHIFFHADPHPANSSRLPSG